MTMVEGGGGGRAKCFPARWNVAARPCDSCNTAAALLFCRKDTAFLCMACDIKLHGHTKHERVWMCEVCEQVPACVTCKADAAALCVKCDRDIHSANPLARRHKRIPVVPFYDSAEAVVKSADGNLLDPIYAYESTDLNGSITKEDNISWGIPTDATNIDVKFPSDTSPAVMKSIDLFPDADHLLNFGFPIPTDARLQSHLHHSVNDSVVPVQTTVPVKNFLRAQVVDHQSPGTRYEIDFTRSAINSYNKCSSQSHSHSVSSSSMDAGVVPEGNSLSDISYPFMLPVNAGVESNGGMNGTQKATQLSGLDREARVLRYREKRKNRKFEKKIRYASRKAYAEARPRIKGRFAKRTEKATELDVDQWLFTADSGVSSNNSYGGEVEYGVVPSF